MRPLRRLSDSSAGISNLLPPKWPEPVPCRLEQVTFDAAMTHLETGSERSQRTYAVQIAKSICRSCPMREACLMWALDHAEGRGIWGGKTPRERVNMARRIRRQK